MNVMQGGYNGQILCINLSDQDIRTEPTDDAIARNFLGGQGYATKILFDKNPVQVDPYAPDNHLLFFTTPLMGTKTPCAVKCAVVTKSPLTQTILMTFSGGHFGTELKFTGYDGIVITGKAEKPVYIEISNNDVQIKDASSIWGKDTVDAEYILKETYGDKRARVACIGPAGEKLVKYACITNERRTFGRGGAGAVMGSKNLKAILVRGTRRVKLFDEAKFNALAKEIRGRYKDSEAVKYFAKHGTSFGTENYNQMGILPTRNFQAGTFEGAQAIGTQSCLNAEIKHIACHGCPIGCSAIRETKNEQYGHVISEGPEYETLFAFGSQCGNSSLDAIIVCDDLCDRLGLDTVSTGNTIGWAMECFEKGLITIKDTDGLELKFGNHQAMVEMVSKIALREGLGDLLAEGTARASQSIGGDSYKFAMQVKGSELAGFDARGIMAMGLGFATSPRGGDHERAYVFAEVGTIPPLVDPLATEGKAALLKYVQDEEAVIDALGICCFLAKGEPMGLPDYARLYTYATGLPTTQEDLMIVGERIWNLARLYNVREGFSRKHDTLPERFLAEVLPDGKASGHTFPLELLLDDYYRVRSWNHNGVPTRQILDKLGLVAQANTI